MAGLTATPDGHHHPASEDEIRELIRRTALEKRQLQVIGSAHPELEMIAATASAFSASAPRSEGTLDLAEMHAVSLEEGSSGPVLCIDAGALPTAVDAVLAAADLALPDPWDAVERIRLIDGTGKSHEVSARDRDVAGRDLFFAAGLSLGLLGVITRLWLRTEPSYAVAGQQMTRATDEIAIDFFGDRPDRIPLQDYLRRTSYANLTWWPGADPDRIEVRQARRMRTPPAFTPRPLAPEEARGAGPHLFQDSWTCTRSSHPPLIDGRTPRSSELWIPIHRAELAMAALRDLHAVRGEPFTCVIRAARSSRFWLSPAFDADVVRFEIAWLGESAAAPAPFEEALWQVLAPFRFRPHWGKLLPEPAADYVSYYRTAFPRMRDFLKLRARLDPAGVFATAYLRDHLGF